MHDRKHCDIVELRNKWHFLVELCKITKRIQYIIKEWKKNKRRILLFPMIFSGKTSSFLGNDLTAQKHLDGGLSCRNTTMITIVYTSIQIG